MTWGRAQSYPLSSTFSPTSAQRWQFPSFSLPPTFFFNLRRRATFLAVGRHLPPFSFFLPCFCFSHFFNSTDVQLWLWGKQSIALRARKKWRMAGVGLRKSIRECREKAWGGSEGKQREGEVSLTSGFLSAVSATRSREGRGYFGLAHSGKRGGKRRWKMQLGGWPYCQSSLAANLAILAWKEVSVGLVWTCSWVSITIRKTGIVTMDTD